MILMLKFNHFLLELLIVRLNTHAPLCAIVLDSTTASDSSSWRIPSLSLGWLGSGDIFEVERLSVTQLGTAARPTAVRKAVVLLLVLAVLEMGERG